METKGRQQRIAARLRTMAQEEFDRLLSGFDASQREALRALKLSFEDEPHAWHREREVAEDCLCWFDPEREESVLFLLNFHRQTGNDPEAVRECLRRAIFLEMTRFLNVDMDWVFRG